MFDESLTRVCRFALCQPPKTPRPETKPLAAALAAARSAPSANSPERFEKSVFFICLKGGLSVGLRGSYRIYRVLEGLYKDVVSSL